MRDEPALDPVGGVAFAIGGVPAFVGELGFDGSGGAKTEMGEVGGQVGQWGRVNEPPGKDRVIKLGTVLSKTKNYFALPSSRILSVKR
jgi:hypothetical protein